VKIAQLAGVKKVRQSVWAYDTYCDFSFSEHAVILDIRIATRIIVLKTNPLPREQLYLKANSLNLFSLSLSFCALVHFFLAQERLTRHVELSSTAATTGATPLFFQKMRQQGSL